MNVGEVSTAIVLIEKQGHEANLGVCEAGYLIRKVWHYSNRRW